MNFDFMSAKLKHTMWKLHLRDFLDGKPGLSATQATSHRDCDLGKWYYGEGQSKYGAITEMKALEADHELLHRTVQKVIDLKSSGNAAEAEAELAKVDAISKRIVGQLTVIEEKVKAQPV